MVNFYKNCLEFITVLNRVFVCVICDTPLTDFTRNKTVLPTVVKSKDEKIHRKQNKNVYLIQSTNVYCKYREVGIYYIPAIHNIK